MHAIYYASFVYTLLASLGFSQTNAAAVSPDLICFAGSVPCGKVCCITTLIANDRHFCADPSISLCCLVGQHNAGGICCNVGEVNCGGTCCYKGATTN